MLRTLRSVAVLITTLFAASSFGVAPSLSVASTWGSPFNAVQVVGNLAYTGHGRELLILDISNPVAITKVGAIDLRLPVHNPLRN